MTPFEAAFLTHAARQAHMPYIWAARGDWAVRDSKNVPVRSLGCESLAFDCAGLVTWAAWKAGAVDLRGWWNADALWAKLPQVENDSQLALAFYGHPMHATHVAIELRPGFVLEAAGGDSTTLTYLDAIKRDAALVRSCVDLRGDRIGTRRAEALKSLPLRP
jgi:cell wall-associated NlpC family hydrolase